jgi:hypothetical protein
MFSVPTVPIGVAAPVVLTYPVTSSVGALDLTTVTGVTFTVVKPNGSRVTWTGSIVGDTTATLLTATYPFTGTECDIVGGYQVRVNLITAGGSTPCEPPQKLLVTVL